MKRKSSGSFGVLIGLAVVVGVALFVYFSSMFERNAPVITMAASKYWNLKKPLNVKIEDESGINSYKITMKSDKGSKELQYEQLITSKKSLLLTVEPPRDAYAIKGKNIEITVEANDVSKWNFFAGNSARKVFKYIIDKRRPQLAIVANSYKISRGGSALVIFKAIDENLKDLYIENDKGKKFIPQPFYKDGYYISLLAWPVKADTFKATVVATDLAGNVAKSYVPLYLKDKSYRVSNITISDKFLKTTANLANQFEETEEERDALEQFKILNGPVRTANETLIHNLSSHVNIDEKINDFKVNRVYPLKNAAVVAYFGDHRKYYYQDKYLTDSYHLGLDLASNTMAAIKSQNSGKVVFADFNGLYGNMAMIAHGLGFYTIYGHCSSLKVNVGDEIRKNQLIANTGATGYAMGDHLHFGILVQGVEVRPQEWMDQQWIKLNIIDIIKSAKKIINGD